MSTIFETLRDATLRPTATIFCWPRAIGSRPDYMYLTFASTSRATHFCSTSMRSEGSAHTLATSTPRIAIQAGLVESWTGCTKLCRYRNCHCSAASQSHSSPAPRIGKTSVGTTRRESAFRESLCETIPVSVLALQTSTWVGACASPRHVRG